MQRKSKHWSQMNFSPIIHLISDIIFNIYDKIAYFKNNITENPWIFGKKIFPD